MGDVLDLVDTAVEDAATNDDDATLERLAKRLDEVASQRGGEWRALAIAAARARAHAGLPAVVPPAPEVGGWEVPEAPPAVPEAEVVVPAPAALPQLRYAGWWSRVFALLLDAVVVFFAIGFVASVMSAPGLVELVLIPAYFGGFPAFANGVTPGKAALGIAIRTADGGKLAFGRSLWRVIATCLVWVTVIGMIIDAILAGSDPKRQSLHDKMAGTIVVRTR